MKFGVSSSCFYPLETEKAFEEIGKMGIQTAEIFFNSPMELQGEIFDKILKTKEEYSIDVCSVHPCTSSCEPFFFFSGYERRFYDLLEFYKRYFDACNKLDSKLLIIHGMRYQKRIPDEEYFERFSRIIEEGKKFSVTVCQENVFGHVSADPDFLRKMKAFLKDDFKFVFDIKQMRRSFHTEDEFFDEFSKNLAHIHISDSTFTQSCLPPGEGDYDLKSFLEKIKSYGYDGKCIIELYRSNYTDYSQIKKAYDYLEGL